MEDSETALKVALLADEDVRRLGDTVYLDTAGAALYTVRQIKAHSAELEHNLFANPHSHNPGGQRCEEEIRAVRQLVLQHFNANESEYDVIFTKSATDSIKLVCESFDFTPAHLPQPVATGQHLVLDSAPRDSESSVFAYLRDNHTSVVACREMLSARNIQVACVDESQITLLERPACQIHSSSTQLAADGRAPCLFAFPAQVLSPSCRALTPQCNFSGRRFPLSWMPDLATGRLSLGNMCSCSGRWKVGFSRHIHIMSTSFLR